MDLDRIVQEMSFDTKIGEGNYREVYQVSPEVCVKRLKRSRRKNYYFFSIDYPMWLYLLKFGIVDFNKHEFQQYQRLIGGIPCELSSSFARILGVRKVDSESLSFQELVTDYDGSLSQPLVQYEKVRALSFWERLAQLRAFFMTECLPFFNLRPDNVIVKRVSETEALPILYDYKRMGVRTWPFQPQLLFNGPTRRKLGRLFQRLFSYSEQVHSPSKLTIE